MKGAAAGKGRSAVSRGSASGKAGAAQSQPLAFVPEMTSIVGYKLRRAQLAVFQDFIESFQRMHLRPAEFSVLALIARTPGQKQTEIAEQLGIKRANFVALMDGLERRGLAERRKAEGDKRSHSLHLTAEGTRFVEKMVAVWSAHEQRLVEKLGGAAERDRLIALLDRILAD
jgi:DNA-binding MarR family transcriptional regulator